METTRHRSEVRIHSPPFRDGILVFSQPGALPPAALEQVITGVRELDMVEIREQIAAKASA
jgi:thioredoxin 1